MVFFVLFLFVKKKNQNHNKMKLLKRNHSN